MAILAPTIWRVRPGGAITNGGGYDGTSYPGGTDYTQQDAAQASGVLGTAAGTTTFTDAAALFTSQMVGNAIHINSGAGFTAGFYFVVTFNSSTSVVLDRSPGTGSAAVWSLGGGLGGATAHPFEIARDSRSTGDKAVPGNTVYILGSSATPAGPDYSFANNFLNPQVQGNSTAGPIKFSVDPSQPTWRPYISNSGGDLIIANANSNAVCNGLIFAPSSAGNGRILDTNLNWFFVNCTWNMNDIDTNGVNANGQAPTFLNCEFYSKIFGAPVARSSAAINIGTAAAALISGCNFHDLGVIPVLSGRAVVILDSIFTNNVVACVVMNGAPTNFNNSIIRGNTFNGRASIGADGIQITTGEALVGLMMLDNIFSNFSTAGKTAVNISGTTAINDRIKMFLDYNDYYNNTANVAGFTIGANDLTLDPQYVSSTDLTLNGTNLQGQAFPRAAITGG